MTFCSTDGEACSKYTYKSTAVEAKALPHSLSTQPGVSIDKARGMKISQGAEVDILAFATGQ